MTLLPVVERELRVAARGRNTYRVRLMAAFFTVLFSIFSLWFVPVFFGQSNRISPRELFLILTWIEFVFVLIAGFALTCDSISEEKRDSTLGLLFLTDLKGYDVVLGKLSVAAVRGWYAMIATVPVLAIPLMLGGTDLAELARTTLALSGTLLFSMGLGMATSALMRRNWAALGLSAFGLTVFAGVLPLCSALVRNYFHDPSLAYLIELPSPTYAMSVSFSTAVGLIGAPFVASLSVIGIATVVTVAGAAMITPRVWKDRPPSARIAWLLARGRDCKYGTKEARAVLRRRLLALNPIYWLCRRERVSSGGLMLLIAAGGMAAGRIIAHDWFPAGWQDEVMVPFVAWTVCAALTHVLIILRLPVIAVERFGDDRRSGALELILSTPMTVKEILAGHWKALRRYFAGPALLVLGMHLLVLFLFLNVQSLEDQGRILGLGQILRDILEHLFFAPIHPQKWEFHFGVVLMVGLPPVLILNWVALGWLSTWLSLRVKNALTAPLASLLLLHAPPWVAQFLALLAVEDLQLRPSHGFTEALLFCGIGAVTIVGHQLLCIGWSRRQVYRHFRTAATDRYSMPKSGWTRTWELMGKFRRRNLEAPPVAAGAGVSRPFESGGVP